jgi:hypothetical protein
MEEFVDRRGSEHRPHQPGSTLGQDAETTFAQGVDGDL